jgi:addiction module RelE/StbE family toxin
MRISFHKNFEKKFKKLNIKVQKTFYKKLKVFSKYPFNSDLNNHALKGSYSGYRSINVTGDIRAVFKYIAEDIVEFDDIDNHSKLYT